MKKLPIVFILSFLVCISGYPQEIFTSAGEYNEDALISMSWTIGECIIETSSDDNIILTQGFQQSIYEIFEVTQIIEFDSAFSANIYPNPFLNRFIVECVFTESSEIVLEIYNYLGLRLFRKIIEAKYVSEEIDMNLYGSGHYLLKIQNADSRKIFKIIKQ